MASPFAAAFAGLAALLFFTAVGAPISLRLFPSRALAFGFAPTVGWAAFCAAALPILCAVGFGPASVSSLAGMALAASAFSFMRLPARGAADAATEAAVPAAACLAAALLALVPALALLPKEIADGVLLAAPIFDHSKVAIVDEIARNGVPAHNPFYGEAGSSSGLAYYYLWHFGAAMLSLVPGVSGWEADIGLTWFTAFATSTLVMALAVRIADRSIAAYWALALTATASARPLLAALLGQEVFGTWLSDYPDLGGALAQATWAPQHVAAAGCVVVALLLLRRLPDGRDWLGPLALGILAAAAFGSSVWVGGVVFVLAAAMVGVLALLDTDRRGRLVARALLAAAVAIAAAAPILAEQARAALTRPEGLPIAFHPYEVLGPSVAEPARRALDLVAFWLVQLPVDLPAIFPAGVLALVAVLRSQRTPKEIRRLADVSAFAAAASFGVAWLLASTLLNNDLGWRAILPGVLMLTAFAAAGLSRWVARPPHVWAAMAAIACLLAGAYGALMFLDQDVSGRRSASARAFAQAPELWRAARRHAGPTDRIANNPDLFADVTRWPINISWALLSDRRSCYAGWELARPFAPASRADVDRVDREFRAAFAGEGSAETVRGIFARYDCRLAVVTATDGAWTAGTFDRNADFELLEERAGAWRIYRFRPGQAPVPSTPGQGIVETP